MDNEDEERDSVMLSTRVDRKTIKELTGAAISEHRTLSEIVRRYLHMGLKNDGYRRDDERLSQIIRNTMQEVLKPHVERLASISAKAANIDGASFFLLTYIGRLLLPSSERQLLDEAAENARRLGLEYLKLKKDRNLDEFIQNGIKAMQDTDDSD